MWSVLATTVITQNCCPEILMMYVAINMESVSLIVFLDSPFKEDIF